RGSLEINTTNLILLLQGKVYTDYTSNDVTGTVSRASFAAIRQAVRSRVLALTIELEKAVAEAAAIAIGKGESDASTSSPVTTQISQQIIYGNVTSISATGEGAQVNVSISKGDAHGLVEYLKQTGIAERDAKQLAKIVASEEPESREEPLGTKAKKCSSKT